MVTTTSVKVMMSNSVGYINLLPKGQANEATRDFDFFGSEGSGRSSGHWHAGVESPVRLYSRRCYTAMHIVRESSSSIDP
jgi:hypothetical protein